MPPVHFAAVLFFLALSGAHGAENCAPMQREGVEALFDEWHLALVSLDHERAAQRYWPDAVLIWAAPNGVHTTSPAIDEFFAAFQQSKPRARIVSRDIQIGCNVAIDSGRYVVSWLDQKGRSHDSTQRYTLVHTHRENAWRILHHHSSIAPPEPAVEPRAKSGTRTAPASMTASNAGVTASHTGGSRPFLNLDASPSVASFYPDAARAGRQRGDVALRICVAPDGELQREPDVLNSSGSPQLDAAAQAWAYAARWIPATRDSKPADGCTDINVVFDARV